MDEAPETGLPGGGVPLDVRLRILGGRSRTARRLFAAALSVRDRLLRLLQAHEIARRGRTVDLTTEGVRMRLHLSDYRDYRLYRHLRRGERVEPGTSALLRRLLAADGVFVDVGANNGIFSLVGAARVGPSGRVYAFEPHPRAFARLEENLRLNGFGQVRSFPVALGREPGRAVLSGALDDGMSSLKGSGGPAIDVEVDSLDHRLPGARVDLVKIDAEGSELEILEGMRDILRSNPRLHLIVEWNRDYASRELWDFLAERFALSRIDDEPRGRWRLTPVRSSRELPSLCNLLGEPRPGTV